MLHAIRDEASAEYRRAMHFSMPMHAQPPLTLDAELKERRASFDATQQDALDDIRA